MSTLLSLVVLLAILVCVVTNSRFQKCLKKSEKSENRKYSTPLILSQFYLLFHTLISAI